MYHNTKLSPLQNCMAAKGHLISAAWSFSPWWAWLFLRILQPFNQYKAKAEVLGKPPWEEEGLRAHPLGFPWNLMIPRESKVPLGHSSDTHLTVSIKIVSDLNSVFRTLILKIRSSPLVLCLMAVPLSVVLRMVRLCR